jgi:hypothetical protein
MRRRAAWLTLLKVMAQFPAARHAGQTEGKTARLRGVMLMRPHTYEITFAGQAGSVVRAELEDCELIVGRGTTTVRAELPDQGALLGLIHRITGLGLELVDIHLVTPLPEQ